MSLVAVFTVGCATTPEGSYEDPYAPARHAVATYLRYEDVPIPSTFLLIHQKSLSVESGSSRIASLHYQGRGNRIEIINFYKEYMPDYGWRLVNLIEGAQTIMNYSNGGEMCTIVMTGDYHKITLNISLSPEDKPKE